MANNFSKAFIAHALTLLAEFEIASTSGDDLSSGHITGYNLTLSRLVALSSRDTVSLHSSQEAVYDSHNAFNKMLNSGATIYGVNTGFGGSAGARTTDHEQLQLALIQMLNSASYPKVLPQKCQVAREEAIGTWEHNNDNAIAGYMPVVWIRAAMLLRVNTLLRGHSGVSPEAIASVLHLLRYGIAPVIPMIGSISASGDLIPLSYVVSTLQGNPTTMVYHHLHSDSIEVISADEALRCHGLSPLICGPKESLAMVNGTAVSDAVGGLVMHDAIILTALAQILTAMGVEAMAGHLESFDPYLAEVKNDDQHAEIARNIQGFLKGSKFTKTPEVRPIHHSDKDDAEVLTHSTILGQGQKLAQDRYALRTSAQWLSPPTQDIQMAFGQLQKVLNSTTDNPIVDARDPSNPRIINGGNFQGSVTAGAMDKTRSALQLVGKLMFAQSTEAINPVTNNGLPANLAATDPSMNFCCKGLDINIAACLSELGWLAHPVGPHVQSAEMHNQAVNSLALISARKTVDAVSLLQKMMASTLYILCQALDVRAMQEKFFQDVATKLRSPQCSVGVPSFLRKKLWIAIKASWEASGMFDLVDRVDRTITAVDTILLEHFTTLALDPKSALDDQSALLTFGFINGLQNAIKEIVLSSYNTVCSQHFLDHASATPKFLGKHTAAMYTFIRQDLGVPMFQGLADNPTRENGKNSIGGHVGVIESALKSRKVLEVLGKAIRDVAGIDVVFPGEEKPASNDDEKHI